MGDGRRQHIPLRRKVAPTFADIEPLPDTNGYGTLNLLISSMIGFGLPAFLADRWLGTTFIVGIGLVVGMAFALTVAWFRYGTGRRPNAESTEHGQPKHGQMTTELGSDTTEDHG